MTFQGAFSTVSDLFPIGLPIVVSRRLHAAKGHLQHLTNPHSHPRYPKVNSITKSTCLNIVSLSFRNTILSSANLLKVSHEVSFSVSKHNVIVVSLNPCLSRAKDDLQDLTLTFPKAKYLLPILSQNRCSPSLQVGENVAMVFFRLVKPNRNARLPCSIPASNSTPRV